MRWKSFRRLVAHRGKSDPPLLVFPHLRGGRPERPAPADRPNLLNFTLRFSAGSNFWKRKFSGQLLLSAGRGQAVQRKLGAVPAGVFNAIGRAAINRAMPRPSTTFLDSSQRHPLLQTTSAKSLPPGRGRERRNPKLPPLVLGASESLLEDAQKSPTLVLRIFDFDPQMLWWFHFASLAFRLTSTFIFFAGRNGGVKSVWALNLSFHFASRGGQNAFRVRRNGSRQHS